MIEIARRIRDEKKLPFVGSPLDFDLTAKVIPADEPAASRLPTLRYVGCNCCTRLTAAAGSSATNPHLTGSHLESVLHIVAPEDWGKLDPGWAAATTSKSTDTRPQHRFGAETVLKRVAENADADGLPALRLRIDVTPCRVLRREILGKPTDDGGPVLVRLHFEGGDCYEFAEKVGKNDAECPENRFEEVITCAQLEEALAEVRNQLALQSASNCSCALAGSAPSSSGLIGGARVLCLDMRQSSRLPAEDFAEAKVWDNNSNQTKDLMRIRNWPILTNTAAEWIRKRFSVLNVLLLNQVSAEREDSGAVMQNHRAIFRLDETLKMGAGELGADFLIGEGFCFDHLESERHLFYVRFPKVEKYTSAPNTDDVLQVDSCLVSCRS